MIPKNFTISSIRLILIFLCTTALAQPPSDSPAPAGPPNITQILERAGQFTTFIRLLLSTVVADQIRTQLNNSDQGMTVFAPTDNAFSSLPAGTLNSLSSQQQVQLVQFHVIPDFLSVSNFETVSNPLRTQAGSGGEFPLNVSTSGNQVNLTTGVVNATVDNTISTGNRLAIYQVNEVLLPLSIFGSPAPSPSPTVTRTRNQSDSPASGSPTVNADAPVDSSYAVAVTPVTSLHGLVASTAVVVIVSFCS